MNEKEQQKTTHNKGPAAEEPGHAKKTIQEFIDNFEIPQN